MGRQTDLVAEIYAAAVIQSRWQDVLKQVVDVGPGIAASLLYYEDKNATAPFIRGHGYSERMVEDYVAYYYSLNSIAKVASRNPAGTIIGISNVGDVGAFRRSEFFTDFLAKWGMGAGAQVSIAKGRADNMHFTLELPFDRVDKDQNKVETFVRSLAPHFAHAFELLKQVQSAEFMKSQAFGLLDFVGEAAFLLDEQLYVHSMNSDAQALLPIQSDILVRNNRLSFSILKLQAYVESAMRKLAGGTLPQPLLALGQRGRMLLRIWPVPNVKGGSPSDFQLGDLPPPLVCLAIRLIDQVKPANTSVAVQLFDLTPAEAKLAQAIAAGTELNNYAAENRLSRHTVRNQLKVVFSKMGVSRQVELALLMQKLKR